MNARSAALSLCTLLMLAACSQPAAPAPAPAAGTGSRGQTTAPRAAQQPAPAVPQRTLRIVIRAEPGSIAGTILIPTGISTTSQRRLFSAGLTLRDADGNYVPYLAESVPQLDSDSWRVLPDGRMETTYRLRDNLSWHDGRPISAEDFVFARSVYSSPDFGVARSLPHSLIEEVQATDGRTVLIRWKEAYPDAAQLDEQDFAPLPRHLLESSYDRERENLQNDPYWTREYVHAGPYKMDRWEPGAFYEGAAFERHALGRPKVDRIRVTWNADFNANLATLLAGEADMPLDDSIRVEQGLTLEREWAARAAGTVLYRPDLPRFVQVQHRQDYANPQLVRDVRFRKGLAHAIDRDAINEALFQGKGLPSFSLVYPTVHMFDVIDRATVKYPYDQRQAEQLFTEAGLAKQSGAWATPAGTRLNLEIRNIQSAQNDAERSIISDGWRQMGIEVEEDVFTPVQTRDGQLLGTFRALSVTSAARTAHGMRPEDYTSQAASRPETRWLGQNRGGWLNPEYDRLISSWLTTLNRDDRQRLLADAVRVRTDDLAVIPLHFNPGVIAFATGLNGIRFKAPDVDPSWNIYEWEWK